MPFFLFRILAFAFLITSGIRAFSQKLYFEHYNVNNNLPSSQVNTVFQDSYGFIWVGTAEGIRKFDGANFKEIFSLNDKEEIGGNINSIVESEQFIFISSNQSVYKSFGNYFKEIKFQKSEQLTLINKIIVADSALLVLTDNGLWTLKDTLITKVNTKTLIDFINIKTAHYSKKNKLLWLGTESNGLIVYNLSTQKIVTTNEIGLYDLYKDKITSITEDSNGSIFFSVANKGVFSVVQKHVIPLPSPTDIDLSQTIDVKTDREQHLWIATLNSGLITYKQGEYKRFSQQSGLNPTSFLSVLVDKENNIWTGSLNDGLFQLKKNQFVIYNQSHGLLSDKIISIKKSETATPYILTEKGVCVFTNEKISSLSFLNQERISVINKVSGMMMVAGTEDGKVIVFNEGGRIKDLKICQDKITAIDLISDSKFIVATINGHIYYYNLSTSVSELFTKQMEGLHINSIAHDKTNTIWLATSKGVFILKGNQLLKQFEDNESLSINEIFSLEIQNQNLYIIPECCGVWFFDIEKNKLTFINKTKGLSGNSARALYVENSKEAFITTSNILNHVFFSDSNNVVKQYKGYSNQEYTEFAFNALQKDIKGNLLAGTSSGLLVYNEKNDSLSKLPPKVVIEDISLMNSPVNWALNYTTNYKTGLPKNLVLSYDQNDIAFEFIGIKFSSNEKQYYSYKLIGFHDEWVYNNDINKAVFSNLPDGNYEFLVRVSNNNVIWSHPLSYKFKIEPPFWKTKWFIAMMLLLLVLIIILVFNNQVTFNKDLVKNNESTEVPLKSARMFMLFAGIIVPVSGVFFSYMTNDKGIVLALHLGMSIIIYFLTALTYFSKFIQAVISKYLLYSYVFVLASYEIIVIYSNIHVYQVIALILAITTGSAIISKLRTYIYISIFILTCSAIVAYSAESPIYNPVFFMFGVFCSTAIGILILLVKLNLSERLIFADSVINKGNSLVIAGNKKGDIIYVSENITSLLGYEKNEVLGDKWWELTAEDTQLAKDYTYQNPDENAPYSRLVKTKFGEKKWIQWIDKKFDDNLIVGIGTDITIQKEYQEKFEYIVENANEIIYTLDVKGRFTYTNEVAQRITGYSKDDFTSMRYDLLIDPAYKKQMVEVYKNLIALKQQNGYYEFPIRSKSGKTIWLGQSLRIIYNSLGQFVSAEAICRDITELVIAKEHLDSNNKRLQLLNHAKEKILISQNIDEVCANILKTLADYAHVSTLMSIHISVKRTDTAYVYSVDRAKNISNVHYPYINLNFLKDYFPELITKKELILNKEKLDIWKELFYYVNDSYLSSLIVPVLIEEELVGLINFFAPQENAYNSDDTWLLNDVAISLGSFIVLHEQKEIISERNVEIEKYNQRLEILNYTKQRLIESKELSEVYKELILVLKEKLQGIFRVSVSVFDIDKNISQVYFLNTQKENDIVENKLSVLHNTSSIPVLLKGENYYDSDFKPSPDFSDYDNHWYELGVKSMLCLPIKINGKIFGALNLMASYVNHFSDQDQELIQEIVETSAHIIEQIIYKNIINEKNKDITDNIQYAKYIQDALMPGDQVLKKSVSDSFLYFSQRDILGGDFYWFDTIGDYTYVVVGDCTGHGVSGSLLSILSSNFIKQAILENHMIDPASILEYLNLHIQTALNQYNAGKEIIDGLDITLLVLDRKNHVLGFSAAMHTAFMIRDNELSELKGNRKPIGSGYDAKGVHFTTHILPLKEGDCFYLTTDGYIDQFNGKNGKKFSRNRFKQLLLTISDLPMSEQKSAIIQTLEKWKVNEPQTDDICVIGIRY